MKVRFASGFGSSNWSCVLSRHQAVIVTKLTGVVQWHNAVVVVAAGGGERKANHEAE